MKALNHSMLLTPLVCWNIVGFYPKQCLGDFHATASVVSNYISRGYSKSNDHFAYRANIDYEHPSGLYFGSSAATVNFGDDGFVDSARFEIAPYIGWSFNLNDDLRLDSQWSRYLYDGKIFGIDSDYNEFYLFIHFRDILSLASSFSEDYYNRGQSSGIFELTGRYPITDFMEFSTGIGYSLTRKSLERDYLFWNAGVTCFYQMISLDLRYADATVFNSAQATSTHGGTDFYPGAIPATLLFSVSLEY